MLRVLARQGRESVVDVTGRVVFDDQGLMVEAALAGAGIAYVIDTDASRQLASGRLRTVLEDWCPPSDGVKLYYSGHRRVPPALRAVLDVARQLAFDDVEGL